jgi:amino acid transporter
VAILFTTLLAFFLIGYADLTALGGTTALLLLCVFAVVNVAVLVLRRDGVEHKHFHAPTALPVLGFILCVYLASPLSGRAKADYKIAGYLMIIGIGLWAITWLLNKYVFKRKSDFDPSHLDPSGPVN